jgi:hypothetical protein
LNLGIDPWPGGLFWTARIGDDAVDVHLGAGAASMVVENLPAFDYFKIPNGVFHLTPPDPATVSFDIEWSGPVTNRTKAEDATKQVEGDIVQSQATMTWSAQNSKFKFVSDPGGTTSVLAQVGRMRNGRFFGG